MISDGEAKIQVLAEDWEMVQGLSSWSNLQGLRGAIVSLLKRLVPM